MNWMEFVSSIVKSIVWPIVVLAVVIILRKQVANVFGRIAELKLDSLKYKDFEATFSLGLQKAEDQLNDTEKIENETTNDSAKHNEEQYSSDKEQKLAEESSQYTASEIKINNQISDEIKRLAREAPHLGVFASWNLVEDELNATLVRLGVDMEQLADSAKGNKWLSPRVKIKYLINNGYLNANMYPAFMDLFGLRNVAVHDDAEAKKITYAEWKKYSNLIEKIIKELKNITVE